MRLIPTSRLHSTQRCLLQHSFVFVLSLACRCGTSSAAANKTHAALKCLMCWCCRSMQDDGPYRVSPWLACRCHAVRTLETSLQVSESSVVVAAVDTCDNDDHTCVVKPGEGPGRIKIHSDCWHWSYEWMQGGTDGVSCKNVP